MDISEAFDFLNFWINKNTGAWYTIPELTSLVDGGQISYFTDKKAIYATSQEAKTILSPFRKVYDFTPTDTPNGVVTVPLTNPEFLEILTIRTSYSISNHTVYNGIPFVNEDVIASKLSSQTDPVTVAEPICEQLSLNTFQLYPQVGYTGRAVYFSRPIVPVFAYTVISGRVIVYDPTNSVQLQWKQTDIIPILLKSLQSIGINLSSDDVSQFAQMRTQSNFVGQNRL